MNWTPEQDQFLMDHAHEGAEAVQKGMLRAFGIVRTVSAITSHGWRIGASWKRWEYCQRCGHEVESVSKRTGFCKACSWELAAIEQEGVLKRIEEGKQRERESRNRYYRAYKKVRKSCG